ncbi:hypothetical protein GDO81_010105 [Engystomops pustulosus]|uniref:Secreted protein n=1 Tax=Engystomops pustulosus TaxID=76066 RepID=A0AAV7BWX4_ENGPU|nr:hypothetical protein GDO81_010105 [Engystomops pustulosus]
MGTLGFSWHRMAVDLVAMATMHLTCSAVSHAYLVHRFEHQCKTPLAILKTNLVSWFFLKKNLILFVLDTVLTLAIPTIYGKTPTNV